MERFFSHSARIGGWKTNPQPPLYYYSFLSEKRRVVAAGGKKHWPGVRGDKIFRMEKEKSGGERGGGEISNVNSGETKSGVKRRGWKRGRRKGFLWDMDQRAE